MPVRETLDMASESDLVYAVLTGALLGTCMRCGRRVPLRQAFGASVGHARNDHILCHRQSDCCCSHNSQLSVLIPTDTGH